MTRILLIQAHPDREREHLGHALAAAYAAGARTSEHTVREITLAQLDIPLLRNKEEWTKGALPDSLAQVRDDLMWAEHVVFVLPLWLGDMPALLKAFLEQLLRPGIALDMSRGLNAGLLKGRSARIVMTMGMPALVYRWYFGAHALKLLRRNILQFVGMKPVRSTVIGSVEGMKPARRDAWLETMRQLGRRAL